MSLAPARWTARERVALGALVLAGVAMRVWILASPMGRLDSDEAATGLMARHLLRGEIHSLFWGQQYGGTHEVALVAVVFRLTGTSWFGLKVVPLALHAVAAVLVWRIGRRAAGPRAGALAGAVFWTFPMAFVLESTREWAFNETALVAGLVVVLMALRLDERVTKVDAAFLGIAAGLGWWAAPAIAYLALPVVVWLLVRRRAVVRVAWASVLAALVAASPWIYTNLHTGFASLGQPTWLVSGAHNGYVDHLRRFATWMAPVALGLRFPLSGVWLGGPLGTLAYLAAVAGLGWVAWKRPGRLTPVLVIVACYPFLLGVSIYAAFAEFRYGLWLWPAVAVVVGWALAPRAWMAWTLVLVLLTVVQIGGLPHSPHDCGGTHPPPPAGSLVRALDRAHVTRLFADNDVAYQVMLTTHERIIAVPLRWDRYSPFERPVRAVPTPAYAFIHHSQLESAFRASLDEAGIAYDRIPSRCFGVYEPRVHVEPEQVARWRWRPAFGVTNVRPPDR